MRFKPSATTIIYFSVAISIISMILILYTFEKKSIAAKFQISYEAKTAKVINNENRNLEALNESLLLINRQLRDSVFEKDSILRNTILNVKRNQRKIDNLTRMILLQKSRPNNNVDKIQKKGIK